MQRLEVRGAVRPIYGSLGIKRLTGLKNLNYNKDINRAWVNINENSFCYLIVHFQPTL